MVPFCLYRLSIKYERRPRANRQDDGLPFPFSCAAHQGMYRIALREAAGLSGVIAPLLTAFRMRREAIARFRSAIPNRRRSDAFVRASPLRYRRHAWR